MMVDVYCKMINLNYEFVDLNQLDDLKIKNSGVYFVNPNGVNGEIHNLEKFREKFEIFIVDEVYSDFLENISQ